MSHPCKLFQLIGVNIKVVMRDRVDVKGPVVMLTVGMTCDVLKFVEMELCVTDTLVVNCTLTEAVAEKDSVKVISKVATSMVLVTKRVIRALVVVVVVRREVMRMLVTKAVVVVVPVVVVLVVVVVVVVVVGK